MFTYKAYAFVQDGIVVGLHYYDSATDTTPFDTHPQVIAVPEDKLNINLMGWQYVNGEFIQ